MTTRYSTTLSSSQVINNQIQSSVYGIAYCELQRAKPQYVYCHVCHQVVAPTAAYIELGATNTGSTPVYQFSVPLTPFFEEIISLEQYQNYPIYNQIEDYLNGQWSITIYNSEDIRYNIRGQLELNNDFYAYMANENTFPPAFGSPHRGITLATYSRTNPPRTASFDICHNVGDVTQTLLGRGIVGLPGEYFYDFRSTDTLTFHQLQYTVSEQEELFQGFEFTQINSLSNPQGAVRGQLQLLNKLAQISLTARMDGSQTGTNSTARGCALVYYDCETKVIEYLVFHSVSQPTSAQLRVGPPGKSGPIFFVFDSAVSPIYGTDVMTEEEVYYLYSELTYIQINSPNYVGGEIRGQLTTQFDFYAYMTGNQVVPPVTTANMGCGTFNFKEFNYVVDFEIMHSLGDSALSVDIGYAASGSNSPLLSLQSLQYYDSSNSTLSPIIGDIAVDDDDSVAIVTDNAYIQVTSQNYPFGEIRGQIYRINPCNPNATPQPNKTEGSFVNPSYSIIQLPIVHGDAAGIIPSWCIFVFVIIVSLILF